MEETVLPQLQIVEEMDAFPEVVQVPQVQV